MTGFQNGNSAGFPIQDEDAGRRKEDGGIRKDGIGTPPIPHGGGTQDYTRLDPRYQDITPSRVPLAPGGKAAVCMIMRITHTE